MRRQKGKAMTAVLPLVRVYPEELQSIVSAANKAGITVSHYIRSVLNSALAIAPEMDSATAPSPAFVPSPSPIPLIPSTSPHPTLHSPSPQTHGQFQTSEKLKTLHAHSFVDETVARKTGHPLACPCTVCARIRSVLSTSKPAHQTGKRKR